MSPYFINSTKSGHICLFHDAFLLLSEAKISSIHELMPALELMQKNAGKRKQLLIIAEDLGDEVLSTLVLNRVKIGMQVCAVKAPGIGSYHRKSILEDIATATGATLFGSEESSEARLEDLKLSDFGQVGEIRVSQDSTILLHGKGHRDAIERRVQQIHNEIESISLSSTTVDRMPSAELEKERLKERYARLTNGAAIIKVGGISDVYVSERIDIIENALNATKCAIDEGIVPGGGVALLRAIKALEKLTFANSDQNSGLDIIRKALKMPALTIANNAGRDASVVVDKILNNYPFEFGYDALNNAYVDMFKSGIVDPTKVGLALLFFILIFLGGVQIRFRDQKSTTEYFNLFFKLKTQIKNGFQN